MITRCRHRILIATLGFWLFASLRGFAQADQPIYGDSLLNGWQNWSWATVNLNSAAPVHGGAAAISVSAGAWQALYLHHDAFDSTGANALVFWIHGGSTGGQQLQVQAQLSGTAQTAVALPPLAPNVWQQVTLSLTSLGVGNRPNLDGFWIQDRSGTIQATYYVDDIMLKLQPAPSAIHLNVDANQVIRVVDQRQFGLNAAVWDNAFDTATTTSLLTEMGNGALRFPGGSLSDDYHWASNTTGNNTWQWATSFDQFAAVATATHAQSLSPSITVPGRRPKRPNGSRPQIRRKGMDSNTGRLGTRTTGLGKRTKIPAPMTRSLMPTDLRIIPGR